jgi:glycosyltransferase involved in cell wall biosynthesis
MHVVIVSDACDPPANGVSRTLGMVRLHLERLGHRVDALEPHLFRTVPCPTDPGIRLALRPGAAFTRRMDGLAPQIVVLATEGPLGLAGRRWCLRRGVPFVSLFTTKFPEAIELRLGIPAAWTYALLRWFHRPSRAVLAATPSLREELRGRGFARVVPWSRGVDADLFRPRPKGWLDLPRPVFLYVGRLAVEKSVEDFLALDLPGSKLVVGDGALLPVLRRRYPGVRFAGLLRGEELARHYAAADVFVFPSRTDTFGLVVLEALASGLPVAAHPVTGPRDIIGDSGTGVLDEDLGRAARAALGIDPARCRAHALGWRWEDCAARLSDLLREVAGGSGAAAAAPGTAASRAGPWPPRAGGVGAAAGGLRPGAPSP